MKKLSFAMFVIVGLFMLFSGIHSVLCVTGTRFPAPMNPQAMRWTWLTYFMKPGFSRLVSRI